MEEILLIMYKKYKYYKRTYNNAYTIYFMLALKYSASALILFNIERLVGQR